MRVNLYQETSVEEMGMFRPISDSLYPRDAAQARWQLWLWPNLLSLDAPIIAVLWLVVFAAAGEVALAPALMLTLGVVVWAIYIADRLLDSWGEDTEQGAARHRFCGQHRAAFALGLVLLLAVSAWLCSELPARTLRAGMLMMAVVVVYFAAVHIWRWALPKEAVVAGLFAAGTYLPLWADGSSQNVRLGISVALFAVVSWMNAALIEYSEWIRLRLACGEAPHPSTILAGKHLPVIGVATTLLTGCLAVAPGFHAELPVLSAVALSALALAALGWHWRRLGIDQIRVLADAALLTPGVVLLLMRYST
jgi:hypothetical protein